VTVTRIKSRFYEIKMKKMMRGDRRWTLRSMMQEKYLSGYPENDSAKKNILSTIGFCSPVNVMKNDSLLHG
jgi:hypothetical protein